MSHANNNELKSTMRAAITIALLLASALLLFVAVTFLVAA
jgi:hypothetical protein